MMNTATKANTNQQGSEDAEWLSSPSIGQGASEEDTANESRKRDGTDATELLIRQPGPPTKVHPDGSQEHWHEIYRDSEADHTCVAKSQGKSGIDFAIPHAVDREKAALAVRFHELRNVPHGVGRASITL